MALLGKEKVYTYVFPPSSLAQMSGINCPSVWCCNVAKPQISLKSTHLESEQRKPLS